MKKINYTHGIQHTDIDSEGVTRVMSMCIYEDGSYGLRIITKSDDAEDMDTIVRFTEYGIDMLSRFLSHGLNVIEDYPVKTNE